MSRVLRGLGRPVALVLGIACLLAATTASAQTTLRWKFQKGQVLAQTITQDAKQTMMQGTTPVEITTTQTIDALWTVGDVDAQGNAQVSQEIKRMRIEHRGAELQIGTGLGLERRTAGSRGRRRAGRSRRWQKPSSS